MGQSEAKLLIRREWSRWLGSGVMGLWLKTRP